MAAKLMHLETTSKRQLARMESTVELNYQCLHPLRCGCFLDNILSGILLLLLIPIFMNGKK